MLAAMEGVAANQGVPMTTLASPECRTSVALGAKRPDQLEGHLRATEVTLSADDLRALDAASALAPECPGWMRRMSRSTCRGLLTCD